MTELSCETCSPNTKSNGESNLPFRPRGTVATPGAVCAEDACPNPQTDKPRQPPKQQEQPPPQPKTPTTLDKASREKFETLRAQLTRASAPPPQKENGVVSAYKLYGATERLTTLLTAQASYSIDPSVRRSGTLQHTPSGEEIGVSSSNDSPSPWHARLGLLPTFSTWAHVSMIHMYLVITRLRACEDVETYKGWQTQLVDHFFHEAERKIVDTHGIVSGMMRQRYLKDLFVQWRGVMMAYDEGVAARSDAVLAGAVWRNLFKAEEAVDVVRLAVVVGFMRRVMAEWDRMDDERFLDELRGSWILGNTKAGTYVLSKKKTVNIHI
ncbi:CBP3-like protein [Echria macrotheca]|uniref:CBP3-like protein n=1 Tax=Echria macrotheca TaxID=438768 RepID=A0AAJ0BHX9_9PEZI|nr:CBP3-like protein [Echria macrotheca]